MNDAVSMYMNSKQAISDLITEENQHTTIPACPQWTLRDILGHLVGSIEDFHQGNVDDFGEPHWTAAQVDRYRSLDLAGIKARWDDVIGEMGDGFAEVAETDLPDIATHELDVRGAVGNTDGRDNPILVPAFRFMANFADRNARQAAAPALEIRADGESAVIGEGEPTGTLTTTLFEGNRVTTGRRSLAQIRGLDWSTDPSPWIELIAVMPPRDTDLVE